MANTLLGNTDSKGKWTATFFVAALAIFIFSGWAWWHYVRSNPERTFYAALENSLRTQGVTRKVEQASSGQKLQQAIQLGVGQQHVAHGKTTITQEAETNATIKTETISTPQEDFVRYTAIETTQKGQDGKSLDFTKLVNIWGKSVAAEGQPVGELYNEAVLGVVPVANLNAQDRSNLIKFIRDKQVYAIKEDQVQRRLEKGRPVYTYEVTVAPEAYIGMLKELGKAVGLKQLESVDPASYKDTQPLTFQLDIDVWGQHLSSITFAGGERTERIGSYGVPVHVDLPTDAIPLQELQSRLQAVQ